MMISRIHWYCGRSESFRFCGLCIPDSLGTFLQFSSKLTGAPFKARYLLKYVTDILTSFGHAFAWILPEEVLILGCNCCFYQQHFVKNLPGDVLHLFAHCVDWTKTEERRKRAFLFKLCHQRDAVWGAVASFTHCLWLVFTHGTGLRDLVSLPECCSGIGGQWRLSIALAEGRKGYTDELALMMTLKSAWKSLRHLRVFSICGLINYSLCNIFSKRHSFIYWAC